jgi:hypothetical protein
MLKSTHLICPGKFMSLRHACRDKFARAIVLSGQILQLVDNSAPHCFERLEFYSGMFYCAWEALLFLWKINLPGQKTVNYLGLPGQKHPTNVLHVQLQRCHLCSVSNWFRDRPNLTMRHNVSHCNSQRPKTVCTEDDDSATAAHETHWLRAFVRANLSNWRFFARANLFSTRKARPPMRSSWTVEIFMTWQDWLCRLAISKKPSNFWL